MTPTEDEVGIVGEIGPEGRSRFRIVGKRQTYSIGPNVRPCEHTHTVLDERFSTVTCEKCGERLQAFDVLLRAAEWWEELLRTRDNAAQAEEGLIVAEMRRLRALKYVTDDERAKLDAAISRARSWSKDDTPRTRLHEFRALVQQVRAAYLDRKHQRQRARRTPQLLPSKESPDAK